jgi:ferredoxin
MSSRLSINGQAIEVKSRETVLQAALRAGLPFPNSCRVGGCGTCRCQVKSGTVQELTETAYLLSADELAQRTVLACQSVPQGEVAIDHSWAGILAGGGAGKIEFEALNRFESANLAVFTGYEHITPRGSRIAYPPVLATNIYRCVSGSWQMVSHHASPIMQGRAAPTPEPNRTRH